MIDMREVGPTLFFAPPHFYKAIYAQINARSSASRRKMLNKHLSSFVKEGRTWLETSSFLIRSKICMV